MSDPRRPDDPSSIADAAGLFDTSEIRTINPAPAAAPPPTAAAAAPDDEYGLELPVGGQAAAPPPRPPVPTPRPKSARAAGAESDADEALPPRVAPRPRRRPEPEDDVADTVTDVEVPVRAARPPKQRASERAFAIDETDERDPVAAEPGEVDPIWTRGAEWGPDLFRVGLVAAATLAAAWFALGVSFGLAFLVFALGGAAAVLLSYPMAITIERPVRITPEQAVKDFYAAASHHFPHYRRMWLLLSPAAREAGRFQSFADFRSEWARRVEGWKEGKGGRFTPLHFKVGDFRGDKSVGQSAADVAYNVQVFVRDQEDKPLATYKMAHGVVRGPDRMWYLDQGTLAGGR